MRTIAIVGASRGLGLGLAREFLTREWRVIATQRRGGSGLAALDREFGDAVQIETLDVTDPDARADFASLVRAAKPDVLFVSAGISGNPQQTAGSVTPDAFAQIMLTNAHSPLALLEAAASAIPTSGAIVAMTSILGSVGGNTTGGWDTYRASKAALNTLLRCFAIGHKDHAVIAMHPGWVRTDMGGGNAPLSVEESAKGMADVVEANLGTPGCRFLDHTGATLPW